MRRFALRLLRDLAMIPLTAFAVYQLVANLPIQRESEAKTAAIVSVEKQLAEDLGVGTPLGFLRPWQKLLAGERLGTDALAYDAKDFRAALAGSARMGAIALLLALLQGALFAFARLRARRAAPWGQSTAATARRPPRPPPARRRRGWWRRPPRPIPCSAPRRRRESRSG